MMPFHSWRVPGRNPGTSSNVTNGIWNASQNRTNRAALTLESISSTPASTLGWLPTMPTARPFRRANPMMMLPAKCSWTSKKSPSSTTMRTSSFMSYGLSADSGTMVTSLGSRRSTGSLHARRGGSSAQWLGMNDNSRLMWRIASASSRTAKWATPLFALCVMAPPRSSIVTSSDVTALITSGPVTNMWLVPSTMMVKSVMAGEYTAPPAHGPMIAEICGTTPEASVLRRNTSA